MLNQHIRYFIEHNITQLWWDGIDWTDDPVCAKGFSSYDDAEVFWLDKVYKDSPDSAVMEYVFMITDQVYILN